MDTNLGYRTVAPNQPEQRFTQTPKRQTSQMLDAGPWVYMRFNANIITVTNTTIGWHRQPLIEEEFTVQHGMVWFER